MMSRVLELFDYWVVIVLMMSGFYMVMANRNLVRKVIGLNIFQASVFLLYVSMGKVRGATAPVIPADATPETTYSNPLPSVLMLTAIVVGIATTSVALALIVRIKEAYGTIEEDEILALIEEGS
jgi:multicomponent Na+:H+ antiporter subunit C